jgi:uncharacterized damage-inducible protein DinB
MSVEIVLSNWHRLRSKLLETIECFHDEDLAFTPAEGHWTVRELMLHIAHEEMIEVVYGTKQETREWPTEFQPEDYVKIESIIMLLMEVHVQTVDYLRSLSDSDLGRTITAPWNSEFVIGYMIGHTMEHEAHHRGELSLILGLLGREAPDF